MKQRVSDQELLGLISSLRAKSSGRKDGDVAQVTGMEIREMIRACEDLQDTRVLLNKTAWLRVAGKK